MNCPNCGKQVSGTPESCPHCGYPLKLSSQLKTSIPQHVKPEPSPTPPEKVPPARTKTKSGPKVLISLVLVFVVFGIASYLLTSESTEGTDEELSETEGTEVEGTETEKTRGGGGINYGSQSLTETPPGVSSMMMVQVDSLILYEVPSEDSATVPIQPELYQGQEVVILEQMGNWAKVKTAEGNIGWCLSEKDGVVMLE